MQSCVLSSDNRSLTRASHSALDFLCAMPMQSSVRMQFGAVLACVAATRSIIFLMFVSLSARIGNSCDERLHSICTQIIKLQSMQPPIGTDGAVESIQRLFNTQDDSKAEPSRSIPETRVSNANSSRKRTNSSRKRTFFGFAAADSAAQFANRRRFLLNLLKHKAKANPVETWRETEHRETEHEA